MHDPRTPVQIERPVTQPLWPVTSDGKCSCPDVGCTDAGKHPRPGRSALPSGGYGVICGSVESGGSGIVAIDCDQKADFSGVESFRTLCKSHGLSSFPRTLTIETGGGGFHFIFQHPGYSVRNSVSRLAKGVDVRGDGGWIVGPGSPHRSGGTYKVLLDLPIAPLPDWLQSLLLAKKENVEGQYAPVPVDIETPIGIRRLAIFEEECRTCPCPIRPGNGGQNALFHIAARGSCYFALPPETVLQAIEAAYNPRCVTSEGTPAPWTDEEIERKISEALRTNTEICPGPPPENFGKGLLEKSLQLAPLEDDEITLRTPDPDHVYKYKVGASISAGELKKQTSSVLASQLTRHPDWLGVLYWDELHDCVRAIDPPIKLDAETGPLSEADVGAIRIWFECDASTVVGTDELRQIIHVVAKQLKVHPIQDYLNGLPDGDPKLLDTLADIWFGDKSHLSAELIKKFLVSAVRRMLNPGTQVDTMLVLYSEKQGWGKSSWVRNLFGPQWTISQMPDLGNKDAPQQMATCWAVEFSEMHKILSDPEVAKDFLSRTVDTYRKAYGRDFITKERAQVCVGTTNGWDFLRDDSGARRYLPITLLTPIDQSLVIGLRDQVWAAAATLAKDKSFEHWIVPGTELDEELRARHSLHTNQDAWHETISEYCTGRIEPVLTEDIFRFAIMKGQVDWTRSWDYKSQVRINKVLKAIRAKTCRVGNKRGYIMPTELAEATPSKVEIQRRAREEKQSKNIDN